MTVINLSCTLELKIYVSWNNTPLDYGVRVIYPLVANETDSEFYLIRQIPRIQRELYERYGLKYY